MEKTCSKCHKTQPLEEFYGDKYRCKSCHKAYQRAYNQRNPDRLRGYHLKKMYGITLEEREEMSKASQGRCYVCGAPDGTDRNPHHIDHNHDTGELRGLLCVGCNVSLGLLEENPDRIRALADYIEGFPTD